MPSLREETVIPAPLDRVWPLLRDPELVASCIPGAELTPGGDDGLWRGAIKVKFGPTVAAFKGEAQLDFDDTAHVCKIKGRGIDGRGASRALASGTVTAEGDAETKLTIDGEFNVTGPLETFANAGGVHVARALLEEFSSNLAAKVGAAEAAPAETETPADAAAEPAPAESTAPASPPQPEDPSAAPQRQPAGELNAFALMWRVLKSMLGRLVGRKG